MSVCNLQCRYPTLLLLFSLKKKRGRSFPNSKTLVFFVRFDYPNYHRMCDLHCAIWNEMQLRFENVPKNANGNFVEYFLVRAMGIFSLCIYHFSTDFPIQSENKKSNQCRYTILNTEYPH